MDNMSIYNQSREVPQEAQKQFSNGTFSGTDINPMWRIKKLTELFGPCGIGWYYDVTSERAEEHHDMTMAIVDLNLYIKVDGEWSKPIYGTGGNTLVKPTSKGQKSSDEGYKMALTDALSVACKALGIGADIYFAKDKTKYTQYSTGDDISAVNTAAKQSMSPEAKAIKARVDAQYQATRGSAEAAQEAGQRRLKEIEQQMKQARENVPTAPTKGPATDEQIAYIRENADGKTLKSAMEAFGNNLERMTAGQANKLIERIKNQQRDKYNERIAHEAQMESDHGDWGDRD